MINPAASIKSEKALFSTTPVSVSCVKHQMLPKWSWQKIIWGFVGWNS